MKLLQFQGYESPEMWINPEHVSAVVPAYEIGGSSPMGAIVVLIGGKTIHLQDTVTQVTNRILREQ